jgi:hypothetical protein
VTLADYYFSDERLVLIPIEHLSPSGMSREVAALLRERRGWSHARIDLFDRSFALYWARSAGLARRTRTWMPPRLRHVGIVTAERGVRPYAQLLNTAAWMLYATDFDPASGHPELGAYLLAHGDRMTFSGEVTLAALHNGAWWLERTDEECRAFAAAAARSTRPDADGVRAIARALPWLRRLRHETLAPPLEASPHRAVPGTGLLVPRELEHEPRALVDAWSAAARGALEAYRTHWRAPGARMFAELVRWLAADAPPLLVTAHDGRVLWDPRRPNESGDLRAALAPADAAAVAAVREDLETIARHTRAFLAVLAEPAALPAPPHDVEQRGYGYLHRDRGLVAYALDEPGMERLSGPALPFARAMLGARTVHEWAHLAVDAGWVPCVVSDSELAARRARLADQLADTIAALPPALRTLTAPDLATLGGGDAAAAEALAALFCARMPDYQANLLAQRFLDLAEIETYVRHNVRTLRSEYPPTQLLRMLIRYLFERQYLRFSAVADPDTFFVRSTWVDADYFATGVLDGARWRALVACGAELCTSYAVDAARFTATR